MGASDTIELKIKTEFRSNAENERKREEEGNNETKEKINLKKRR